MSAIEAINGGSCQWGSDLEGRIYHDRLNEIVNVFATKVLNNLNFFKLTKSDVNIFRVNHLFLAKDQVSYYIGFIDKPGMDELNYKDLTRFGNLNPDEIHDYLSNNIGKVEYLICLSINSDLTNLENIAIKYLQKVINDKIKMENDKKQVFNLNGPNSRVNINSIDNSTNIVNQSSEEVFKLFYEKLNEINEVGIKQKIQIAISEMEKNVGNSSFKEKYFNFIGICADHLGLFGPLLPMLSSYI